MDVYEIKFDDGTTCHMSGTDGLHACQRAADLHGKGVVAWRNDRRPSVTVLGSTGQIIG